MSAPDAATTVLVVEDQESFVEALTIGLKWRERFWNYLFLIRRVEKGNTVALGRTVTTTWQGRRVEAFVPDPLANLEMALPEKVVRATERAIAAAEQADERANRFETLARLLLRSEGVASSRIEGVRAPAELVAVAEIDASAVDASSAWVADNLAVVDASLEHASSGARLRLGELHAWHRRLMAHGTLPDELVGAFRRSPSWIGATTPRQAAYVPPPADEVGPLMTDLLRFANRSRLDPVTVAAVTHAQFEAIHPYGDGNGRLGRVLIGWVLARRTGVALPPPVSVFIARDIGGYLSGLTRFRRGDVGAWVLWMAEAVRSSADQVVEVLTHAEDVRRRWDVALSGLRADAAARRLVEILPQHLVLTAPIAAELLGVSMPTARAAIAALAARGVLEPLDLQPAVRGRPAHWWMTGELVALVTRWSR